MRRLSAVPLGLLVAGLGVAAARAAVAQQIPVRLGGMTSSFVGLAFDVPLEVDLTGRTDKLGSFAARITWNPSVLHFVSGQDGSFGKLSVNVDSVGGAIRLTGANPGGVGGKVVLGVARFVPLAASSDTFHLDVTELYAAGTFVDLLPSAVWANQPYCPAVGRFGDMDGNGVVNSADALQALSLAAGLAITGNAALGDVDGDGIAGARDALLMLSAGIGLDVSGFRVFLVAPGACAVPKRPLLAMTPGSLTMNVGQQARYTAFASDSVGAGVVVTDVVWRSSDSLVAQVTSLGQVTAVAPGTATITVQRPSGTKAVATITVTHRHTHWVDALASPEDFNQLGAPELPFRTIPQALAYAQAGDTVRVRSGRYDDTLTINRPVVLMGDTTGGKPRPLLAAFWYNSAGITVHTPGRVELQALRLDTLSVGVVVERADTLLVRWMEFRTAARSYQASLLVDTAGVVLVRRSSFFGPGSQYYYANDGIVVDSALVVSIDSSYVAEYGYDAIALYNVDSVSLRGNRILDNYGYGVRYCAQCSSAGVTSNAVFSGNRFERNYYGHVYVAKARTVRFDHNRAVAAGAYYDSYVIYGDTASTLVTLLGDSVVSQGAYWLWLANFDSLAVDSTVVLVGSGYPSINGGRVVSVRDSRLLEVTGEALNISPYPRSATRLLLRRVEFRGQDSSSCDRCGDMVYGSYLNLDADSVRMVNAYYGFDLSYSRLLLRHIDLQHYWYGAYVGCGSVNVAHGNFTGGSYGLEEYGCAPTDSAVVDSVSFAGHTSYALYSSGAAATLVSRSQFSNSYYAINHHCGQLRVSNVTATGGQYGVYGYGCGATDTLVLDQSSFGQFAYGGDLESGVSRITNSVFTDDGTGLYLYYTPALVSANQFIRPRSYGVYHYWYSGAAGATQILNNTVSCDAYGAVNTDAIYVYRPYPGSDTVVAGTNAITNCNSGIFDSGGRRAFIRGNTVALPTSVVGYSGIYVDSDSTSEVVGNAVSGWGNQGSIRVQAVPSARVDSNTVTNAVAAGILFPGSYDTLRVWDNTISHLAYSCCGVSPSGAIQVNSGSSATNALIDVRRNRIADVTNGIVLQRGYGDTVTVQVDSNTVRRADSLGMWVRYYSRARIRYNAIDSSALDAVRLSDNYLAAAPAVLDSNNFTRSRHFGVRNLAGYVVDATDNWWGDATGPACATTCGSGDSVSTLVTFNPFLTIPFSTVLPAPRLVAAASFAPPAVTAAASGAASSRAWERPSAVPPQRALARPAIRTAPASAGSAPASAHAAVRRLEAISREEADRIQQRQAEQAQMVERQDVRRAAWEQEREQRRQAEASREAARQARESAPRRPQ